MCNECRAFEGEKAFMGSGSESSAAICSVKLNLTGQAAGVGI